MAKPLRAQLSIFLINNYGAACFGKYSTLVPDTDCCQRIVPCDHYGLNGCLMQREYRWFSGCFQTILEHFEPIKFQLFFTLVAGNLIVL